jgi:predicted double-glycine peptidase
VPVPPGRDVDLTGADLPAERTPAPVPIPHHFQETDYTCGAASVKMVLEALGLDHVDEAALARRLGTDDEIGTRQRRIVEELRRRGWDVAESHTTTSLDAIRHAMLDGRVVLVLYHLEAEKTDNYAVVRRIGPNRILLHDPWTGPDTEWPLAEFDALWHTRDGVPGRRDRWMVAVRAPTP